MHVMNKPRLADVAAALSATFVALIVIAAFFYVFPSRHLFRGVAVAALATAILAGCSVFFFSQRLFTRHGRKLAEASLGALPPALVAALVAYVVLTAIPGLGLSPSSMAVFTFYGVFVWRLRR